MYASHLRKNLKKYGYDRYIKTFRGLEYMLSEEEEAAGNWQPPHMNTEEYQGNRQQQPTINLHLFQETLSESQTSADG